MLKEFNRLDKIVNELQKSAQTFEKHGDIQTSAEFEVMAEKVSDTLMHIEMQLEAWTNKRYKNSKE